MAANLDNIDTSGFVLKTKYEVDKSEFENKIPDETDFVKKVKLAVLENKILDISNLATKAALSTIENEIPSVVNLVKQTDYNTKITEIEHKLNSHHDKYIITPEFNTLAANVFNARLSKANVITKTTTQNKTKHLLVENKLNQLKTFDSSYFIGKSHLEEDGTQNILVFEPLKKYFKIITNTKYISAWESKGLADQTIKPPTTSNYKLNPQLNYFGTKTRLEFRGSCLKQDKSTFNHGKIVNIYIFYELDKTC